MEVLDNVAFHQWVKRLLHREIEAGTLPKPVPGWVSLSLLLFPG